MGAHKLMPETPVTALKSRMIAAIHEVAEKHGIVTGQPGPGRGTFLAATGYTPYDITRCGWVNWSDALEEAGYQPNALQSAIPLDVLLEHLASLTRQIGRFPTNNHIRVATKAHSGFPSLTTMSRLGSQRDRQQKLSEWCSQRTDYSDVAAILQELPTFEEREDIVSDGTDVANESLSESFIPPVIASLPRLASNDSAFIEACRERNRSLNSEFERRVRIAFVMLGFEVEELGQGRGAVADGIAKFPERQWAVIYDAKVRGSGYRLLTEDRRKFRDYVAVHEQDLTREGIRRIYFAVVSSGFSARDLDRARAVRSGSDARSCVLVEASALTALVEKRIMKPRHSSLDAMETLFEETRILAASDII